MGLRDRISGGPAAYPLQRRPFVIAEAGVNHEGSMDLARRLIDEAAAAGADAIKFQTYRAETLAVRDSPAYWDTTKESTPTQFELFRRYDSFWKREFEALRRHCDEAGIEFLSTPFDVESATFLVDLMGVIKIASADLTNLPYIEYVCGLGKPILLSTGASELWEIALAADVIRNHGVPFALMHCVLNYPTARQDANLGMIVDLKRRFPELVIGYSDHTLPDPEMSVLVVATLLGAEILEKHFTFDKSLPGNDHYHAMDKNDLANFRRRIDDATSLIGSDRKTALSSEAAARRHARRSLVAARLIPKGREIGPADLTWKRPAHGISPLHYRDVLGRRARTDIEADTVLQWSMLE
jgi:sialic acid synthase SpsE